MKSVAPSQLPTTNPLEAVLEPALRRCLATRQQDRAAAQFHAAGFVGFGLTPEQRRLPNLEGWLAGAEFRLAELRQPGRASKTIIARQEHEVDSVRGMLREHRARLEEAREQWGHDYETAGAA